MARKHDLHCGSPKQRATPPHPPNAVVVVDENADAVMAVVFVVGTSVVVGGALSVKSHTTWQIAMSIATWDRADDGGRVAAIPTDFPQSSSRHSRPLHTYDVWWRGPRDPVL